MIIHCTRFTIFCCYDIILFVGSWIIMEQSSRRKRRKDQLYWLGLNLSHYRKLRRMERDELAAKSGVSLSAIACIEATNITTNHKIKTILDLADALEIPPHLLFDFTKGDMYGKKIEG